MEFLQTMFSLLIIWGGFYAWFKYLKKINDELEGDE